MAYSSSMRLISKKCGDSTLNKYIFTDYEHALDWLWQSYFKKGEYSSDECYSLQHVAYMKRPCCGQRYNVKVLEDLSVSEFVKRYEEGEFKPESKDEISGV